MKAIITAPSLDPSQNVSGVSSVVKFIIENNQRVEYIHFELGRKDGERGGIFRISAILKSLWQWRICLKKHPDAIIHYSFPLSAPSILRDPLFMGYSRWKHRKMIVHVHGGLFLTAKHTPWILKAIMQRVFSMEVPFVVLSDMEVKLLKEKFDAQNVIALPNCVSVAGPRWDSNPGPLKLGYLGRIEPNKGMSELLKACKLLKAEGVPFTLTLAGKEETKGEYLPTMMHELGENFHYAGLVSGDEKEQFLHNMDVFMLPSYFEGLPMSMLECMSHGAVPVTTPVGSIPTVIHGGKNGLFIKDHDVESIVNAVRTLHEDRNLMEQLQKNAYATILEQFDPKKYIEKLNALYLSLE